MTDFSAIVRQWLNTHPDARSLEEGAELCLRIDGNEPRYRAMLRRLDANAQRIEQTLRDYIRRRDSIPSRQEAERIRAEAAALIQQVKTGQPKDSAASAREFRAGKRTDHDSLPEEIQLLFETNMALKRRMAQIHLEIRRLLRSTKDCAAADLAGLVSLLKDSDVQYHNNWKKYDSYGTQGQDAAAGS